MALATSQIGLRLLKQYEVIFGFLGLISLGEGLNDIISEGHVGLKLNGNKFLAKPKVIISKPNFI